MTKSPSLLHMPYLGQCDMKQVDMPPYSTTIADWTTDQDQDQDTKLICNLQTITKKQTHCLLFDVDLVIYVDIFTIGFSAVALGPAGLGCIYHVAISSLLDDVHQIARSNIVFDALQNLLIHMPSIRRFLIASLPHIHPGLFFCIPAALNDSTIMLESAFLVRKHDLCT